MRLTYRFITVICPAYIIFCTWSSSLMAIVFISDVQNYVSGWTYLYLELRR